MFCLLAETMIFLEDVPDTAFERLLCQDEIFKKRYIIDMSISKVFTSWFVVHKHYIFFKVHLSGLDDRVLSGNFMKYGPHNGKRICNAAAENH